MNPSITPATCPAKPYADATLRSAQALNTNLHRLRGELENCRHCTAPEACPVRGELSTAIDTAIREITDEWQL